MWRITTTLQVPPWSFCLPVPTEPHDSDGFVLSAGASPQRLALMRMPAESGEHPCVFLLRLPGGHGRCGLGPLRPIGCRAFPCVLADGEVRVRSDVLCTCRDWSLADVDLREQRRLLEQEIEEQHVHAGMVAAWNAFARQLPEDEPAAFEDFCRYLLDMHRQLERTS